MSTKKEKRELNLSLSKELAGAFQLYCAAEGILASTIVEKLLEKYLREQGIDTKNALANLKQNAAKAKRATGRVEEV